MTDVEARLADLGVTLPDAPVPLANYAPYVRAGSLLTVSGQVSIGPDGLVTGVAGADLSLDEAVAAARLCAINLIAQARAACDGDLSRVARVVRLGVFVNCAPGFNDHPAVANGASDLMVAAFGEERGRHARAAVGAPSLPLGAAVEIDGLFEVQ
ncbi:MAG: RidA family protein [Pseudomonadota bacterium]